MQRSKMFLGLVALASLATACSTMTALSRTSPVRPSPTFTVSDYAGKPVSLSSLTADGPLVLVFLRGFI